MSKHDLQFFHSHLQLFLNLNAATFATDALTIR